MADLSNVPFLTTREIPAHDGEVLGLKLLFSPDSKLLASVNMMGSPVRLWDPHTRELVREFPGYAASMTFSPSGKYLLTCSGEKVSLWELNSDEPPVDFDLPIPFQGPHICGFDRDETLFAVGGGGHAAGVGFFRCWDVASGEQLSHRHLSSDDDDEIGVIAIQDDIHGRFCAWAKGQCNLPCLAAIYDLQTGECVDSHIFDHSPWVFPPSHLSAWMEEKRHLVFFDMEQGQKWHVETNPTFVQDFKMSPNASYVAWSERDGPFVNVYDIVHRSIKHRIQVHKHACVAWSGASDNLFATIVNFMNWRDSPEETIFWSANTGQPIAWTKHHEVFSQNYTFSPNAEWFASGVTNHSSNCDNNRIQPGTILLTELSAVLT